jgi:hypothetical protein
MTPSLHEGAPTRYELGQRLVHHSGAVWSVGGVEVLDGEPWYVLRCEELTERSHRSERVGRARRFHRDYVEGDSWRQHGGEG